MAARSRTTRTIDTHGVQFDDDMKPRVDGAQSSGQPSRRRNRRTQALPAHSLQTRIDAYVASSMFWALAKDFNQLADDTRSNVGRPCSTTAAAVLLVDLVASETGSVRSAIAYLEDKHTWQRLQNTAEAAWPHDPQNRLPDKPASRSQHHRYVSQYLTRTDHQIDTIRTSARHAAVNVLETLDMFNPDHGAFTRPNPTQVISGDATVLNAMYNTSHDTVTDRDTGEIWRRRTDPDAVFVNNKEGNAPAYSLVDLVAQNTHPGERVILDAYLRPKGIGDGQVFCDLVEQSQQDLQSRNRVILAGAYDMALSSSAHDRLLDAGIVPVSKVALKKNGAVHEFNLGRCRFILASGQAQFHKVVVINGTPHISVPGIDGATIVGLTRQQTKKSRRKRRFHIGSFFVVPDLENVPSHLRSARVWISHHSTDDETKNKRPRTRNLRVFAPADPVYAAIAGIRENTESMHHHYKSTLTNRRARCVGARRVRYTFHTYQTTVNITTALRHAERTGDWAMFGSWRPDSYEQPGSNAGPIAA